VSRWTAIWIWLSAAQAARSRPPPGY